MNSDISTSAAGFEALGFAGTILSNLNEAGFTQPKPIQALAIPPAMAKRDVLAIAQTGSGKTAAFGLPLVAQLSAQNVKRLPRTVRALILAPTRELAVQIEETIRGLAKGMRLTTALVLGGVSRNSQVKRLAPGVDVLIATPGRLADLVRERDLSLAETRWLVLDEADRMLDMGFIHEVRRLAKATHPSRQTMLFSATMPAEIEELATGFMRDPVRVAAAVQGTTAAEIKQSVHLVPAKHKRVILSTLLKDPSLSSVMVFTRTKHGADKVARNLEQDGFAASVIHGNKSQNARQRALESFRSGSARILVATDIAARGIDVPGISHVINFDLPDEAESYVHRIGRTGRNGADGIAITLCDSSETDKLKSVEKVIRMRLPVAADHRGDAIEAAPAAQPRKPSRPQAKGSDHHRAGRPSGQGKSGEGVLRRERPHGAAARPDAGGERKPGRNRRRRFTRNRAPQAA